MSLASVGGKLLQDLPEVIGIVTTAEAAFSALPPAASRKASDWGTALGFGPGLVMTILQTADTLKAGPVTVAEVLGILGVPKGGLIDQLYGLEQTVVAQLKTP